MKSRRIALIAAAAATLTACAQSPLYETARIPGGTRDEVPRDGNGEPILSATRTPALLPPPPTR